jgi:hypothetical protein
LPRNDPLAAQKALCEVLSDLAARKDLNRELMRALLALDQRSRSLREALLVNYERRNPQAKPFERRYWRAAVELSQAFADTFAIPESYAERAKRQRWREYARQWCCDCSGTGRSKSCCGRSERRSDFTRLERNHSVYQFADARGWSHHRIPRRATRAGRDRDHVAERVRPYPAAN